MEKIKWVLGPKRLRTSASEKLTWLDTTPSLCCPLSGQLGLAKFIPPLRRSLNPWGSSDVTTSPCLRILPQTQEWSRSWDAGVPSSASPTLQRDGYSEKPVATMSNHQTANLRRALVLITPPMNRWEN